jgi:hypothetical protein
MLEDALVLIGVFFAVHGKTPQNAA